MPKYLSIEADEMTPWGTASNHGIQPGGMWNPKNCTPMQQVAILIPYRDRKKQLAALLATLHSLLQRQRVSYRIFVIEQVVNVLFTYCTVVTVLLTRNR